ncbi:hypothetical protein [Legionella tucsonensis]|uniref:hypothetical protein n=1 Tax=Legionella tucsonensis TaxID=40335 RepID=UPI001EE6C53D|nr:hypothetical protein [Legionella tucsonensis]
MVKFTADKLSYFEINLLLVHDGFISNNHFKVRANNAMRVLRAIFNCAMYEYQDGNGHPIITITRSNRYRTPWYGIEWIENKPSSNRINYLIGKAVVILVETDNYRNALLWHDYFYYSCLPACEKWKPPLCIGRI